MTDFPNYTIWLVNATAGSPSECFAIGDIVHIVFCSLVILSGLPGNCLILCVYWAKPRKTSTHVLIMGLACTDFTTCLLLVHAILSNCIFSIGDSPTPMLILRYFLLSSVTVSVQITCLIAMDRYDWVCRSNRRMLSYRRVLVLLLLTVIYSVCTTGMYFAVQAYHRDSPLIPLVMLSVQLIGYVIAAFTNGLCYVAVYRTIRNHVKVRIASSSAAPPRRPRCESAPIEMTWVTANSAGHDDATKMPAAFPNAGSSRPVCFLEELTHRSSEPGPSTIVLDCTSLKADTTPRDGLKRFHTPQDCTLQAPSISKRVTQVSANAAPRASAVVLQRKTTRMLLVTNVVFLLAWVPYWIYVGSLLASIAGVQIPDRTAFLLEKLAYLEYLNSAVNPLIYGVANKRFRKDCKEIFEKCKYC